MNTSFRSLFKCGLCLVWTACSAVLSAQLNSSDTIPIDPGVKLGKLANGLTYYIRKNVKPEKRVELRLVVKAGSILEDDDQQGLAHFAEHMAFNGTEDFKKNELVSFLQSIGVRFGADLNASTGFDDTRYFLSIPTDQSENLETGFRVLENWAGSVKFSKKEIDKERGVVLEEARLRKGAGDRIRKVTLPVILGESKYASRLPIGREETLKTFSRDALVRFYRDWYRPDLMAVIVVGDIDPGKAEELIKKHFEKLKNPSTSRTREKVTVPVYKTSKGLVVTDKEATGHSLNIYYSSHQQETDITWGDYRATVIRNYFRGLLNQRIGELTQNSNPPFLSAFAGTNEIVRGYEFYNISISLGKTGPQPAVDAVFQEIERVRKYGYTQTEFERLKKNIMTSRESAYKEKENVQSIWIPNTYINHFLEGSPMPGIENTHPWYKSFLETVTLEEVNKFSSQVMGPSEPFIVFLTGNEKADFPIPTGDKLVELVELAGTGEVTPYIEKPVALRLMDDLPAGGEIIDEKEIKELGVTELTLSNGVKVLLKPTDFRNDEIVMSSTRWGGSSLYDVEDEYNASYITRIIPAMGIKDFTPSDLRKVLAGSNVFCWPRIWEHSEGISGRSRVNDLETLLQLVYLHFTAPRLDEDLFKSYITRERNGKENRFSNPMIVYNDTINRVLYNRHPRAFRSTSAADLDNMNANRVLEIYRERFGNAAGFTFIWVGSFNVAEMKQLVARYLGGLPAIENSPPPAFRDLGIRPVKGVIKKEVFKGIEPKSYVTMIFTGEGTPAEEAGLKLRMLTEVLNIKLTEVLREEMSSTYGSSLTAGMSRVPYQHYSIRFAAPCGPENVDKVIDASLAEIQKIKDHGPSQEDLEKVKVARLKRYSEVVRQNNFWLTMLSTMVESGAPVKYMTEGDRMVNAITANDLKETARQYFNMNNYVQVVLFPEK